MRAMRFWSALSTKVSVSSWRLRLVALEVRMWRFIEWPRLILPVAVFLKRFAAPLWVFIFGITSLHYNINGRTRPAEMYSPQRHREHGEDKECEKVSGQPNLTRNADPSRSRRIRFTAWLIPSLRRLLRRGRVRSRSLVWLGRVGLGFGFGRVRLGWRLRLGWRQNEVQRVALLPRTKLHDRLVAQVLDQALQNSTSQTLAGHLASAEEDGGLHLVAFGEKAQHVVLLGVVVVIVHIDAELHFLDHDLVLMFLGLALALFLLIQVFPVIHDAANRRLGGGRDFYQVQGFLAGDLERVEGGHDA